MSRAAIPLVIAILLIGLTTYLQGSWTQRWSNEAAVESTRLKARYPELPMRVGTWVGKDTGSDQRQLAVAGAHASISRVYRNSETGEEVSIFMICGYARDVAVHTPDACYVSSGFDMEQRPEKHKLESSPEFDSQFFTSTFRKERGGDEIHQRIFWSWTNDGTWRAYDSPRWHFGGQAVINKIYVINNILEDDPQNLEESPAAHFAKIFLPLASAALYPSDQMESNDRIAAGN